MDQKLEYLLALAGCGAREEAITTEPPCDFQTLMGMASALAVYPFCIRALQKNKRLYEETEGLKDAAAEVKSLAVKQAYAREKLITLLGEMEKEGFRYAVMKGCAIAECYGEPFLRLSSDTDIFINIKQEKEIHRWLKKRGFEVEKRTAYEHHSHVRNKEIGLMELHTFLYNTTVVEYWTKKSGLSIFRFMQNEPVRIEGRQGAFMSLEYTEQMLLITLHFIKHFLSMDVSLRILLDNCMYAVHYYDKIDWEYYWEILSKLEYDELIRTCFAAADRYMGFHLNFGGDTADEKLTEEFLEILCAYSENNRIMKRFGDIYWSRETDLGGNKLWHRLMILWKREIPTTFRSIKKFGFFSAVKRASAKAKRLMTGQDTNTDSEESKEMIARRMELFQNTGLIEKREPVSK